MKRIEDFCCAMCSVSIYNIIIELGLNSGLNNKGWIKKSRFSVFINREINLPNK